MDQTHKIEASLFLGALTCDQHPITATFVPLRAGVPGQPLLNTPWANAVHTLAALNRTGSDIYVTVNETDGVGRRAENISRVRCVFADYDAFVPEHWKLVPSMLVESSPGKAQAYWLLKEPVEPSAQWAAVERAVVWETGADRNVCDIARVLRVPGFVNHKYEAKPLAQLLISWNSMTTWEVRRYTLDEIEAAYGAIAPPAPMAAGCIQTPEDAVKVRRYRLWLQAAGVPPRSSSGRLPIARNWLFRKCAAGVWDFDLPAALVAEVVAEHIEELSYDDAVQFARDAERYGHGTRGSAYVRLQPGQVEMHE